MKVSADHASRVGHLSHAARGRAPAESERLPRAAGECVPRASAARDHPTAALPDGGVPFRPTRRAERDAARMSPARSAFESDADRNGVGEDVHHRRGALHVGAQLLDLLARSAGLHAISHVDSAVPRTFLMTQP